MNKTYLTSTLTSTLLTSAALLAGPALAQNSAENAEAQKAQIALTQAVEINCARIVDFLDRIKCKNAQLDKEHAKQAEAIQEEDLNTAHIKRKREEAEAANKQEDLNTAHIKRKREEAEAANKQEDLNTAQIREQRKEQQKSNAESFEEEKVLHTSNNVLNTIQNKQAFSNKPPAEFKASVTQQDIDKWTDEIAYEVAKKYPNPDKALIRRRITAELSKY